MRVPLTLCHALSAPPANLADLAEGPTLILFNGAYYASLWRMRMSQPAGRRRAARLSAYGAQDAADVHKFLIFMALPTGFEPVLQP